MVNSKMPQSTGKVSLLNWKTALLHYELLLQNKVLTKPSVLFPLTHLSKAIVYALKFSEELLLSRSV